VFTEHGNAVSLQQRRSDATVVDLHAREAAVGREKGRMTTPLFEHRYSNGVRLRHRKDALLASQEAAVTSPGSLAMTRASPSSTCAGSSNGSGCWKRRFAPSFS
jgi:hypothetical protein